MRDEAQKGYENFLKGECGKTWGVEPLRLENFNVYLNSEIRKAFYAGWFLCRSQITEESLAVLKVIKDKNEKQD